MPMSGNKEKSTRMSGAKRRRHLLDAAATIFGSKGFSGTTTKEIANSAHVNESLIFKHFDNKDHLYECVLRERELDAVYLRFIETIRDAIRARNDRKVFDAIARLILHKHRSNSDVYRMVLFSVLEKRPSVFELLKKQMQPMIDEVAEYIRSRTKDGDLNCPDPELYVIALIGMVSHQAMIGEIFTEMDTIPDDERALRSYTQIILDSMRRSETRC